MAAGGGGKSAPPDRAKESAVTVVATALRRLPQHPWPHPRVPSAACCCRGFGIGGSGPNRRPRALLELLIPPRSPESRVPREVRPPSAVVQPRNPFLGGWVFIMETLYPSAIRASAQQEARAVPEPGTTLGRLRHRLPTARVSCPPTG